MNFTKPQRIEILMIVSVLLIILMAVQKSHAKGFNEKQMNSVLNNPQVTINNIDIKSIDNNLSALYPLTCDVWSGFEFEECLELQENNVFFQVEGDYDQDGFVEQYHTGYAQYESGKWAKYLLILNARLDVVTFKVIELEELTDYYNFTGIFKNEGQLYWVECISCDVIYSIKMFDGENTLAMNE